MRVLYVGDLHGSNKSVNDRLTRIALYDPPEVVAFVGDIVGSDTLDQAQKIHYNWIYNPVRGLKKQDPNPTEEAILSCQADGHTVEEGCNAYWEILSQLDTHYNPPKAIDFVNSLLNDFDHFGHFISNLSRTSVLSLAQGMDRDARAIIDVMTQFTRNGSKVGIAEGNWDARTPIDFYQGGKPCRPIPIEERLLHFKTLLTQLNPQIQYFDKIGTISTTNSNFIFLPFDQAMKEDTSIAKFVKASHTNILVSHAQVEWDPVSAGKPITPESEKINRNMKLILGGLNLTRIIHGHAHDGGDYCFQKTPVYGLPLRTLLLHIH